MAGSSLKMEGDHLKIWKKLQLLLDVMPAYYLIYMEMYVLGTNKLKMHTTGVPTFKKIIYKTV